MNKGKIYFFVISFVVALVTLYYIWTRLLSLSNSDDISNVAVEFHGMVFDIILFGILLTIYESYQEKQRKSNEQQQKIERLEEEISDFHGWDEKEAMYRNVGNIRRLNRLGKTDINLEDSFLESASLKDIDLTDAKLTFANVKGVSCSNTKLVRTDFRMANISGSSFHLSDLSNVLFANVYADNASFNNVILKGANFKNAVLHGAKFSNINFNGVENLTINQMKGVGYIFKCKNLPKEINQWLLDNNPSVFEKPKITDTL